MTFATDKPIPNDILEQAFHWAMVTGDSAASAADHRALAQWLQQHPLHRIAWQRMEMMEQEFSSARPAAQQGSYILQRRHRQRRRKLAAGSVLSLLLLCSSIFYAQTLRLYDYKTATGEQQQITLQGGATVRLNSQTALDIEHNTDGITLYLHRGEILVDSAGATPKNKPRLVTQHGQFTPVGTRFVVSLHQERSQLAVTHGRVNISTPSETGDAVAGEQWQIIDQRITQQQHNGLAPAAWTDRVIEANNARLGDVLAALGQYHRGWLRYSDTVAELRVTGVFQLDNTSSALHTLENSLPIHISKLTDWWVFIGEK